MSTATQAPAWVPPQVHLGDIVVVAPAIDFRDPTFGWVLKSFGRKLDIVVPAWRRQIHGAMHPSDPVFKENPARADTIDAFWKVLPEANKVHDLEAKVKELSDKVDLVLKLTAQRAKAEKA